MTESGSAEGGPRILVVGPAWVGDLVVSQILPGLLRDRTPGARVDVLAPPWSRDLVERMPGVDGFVGLAVGHGELGLGTRWRLARRLRRRGYARAVVTKRSLKAALVPWMARIPRRTGFLGEMRFGLINDRRRLDEDAAPLWAQRIALLGRDAGEEPPTPDRLPRPRLSPRTAGIRELAAALGVADDRDPIGFAPGAAYGPSKRWPAERWAALGGRLTGVGRTVWVFGTDDDREAGRAIRREGGPGVRDLTGRTGLGDAVDLLARCRTVVTHDSGLMHVAAAVGCRVVALFGSSDPGYTPPLTDRRRILWLGLPCSPCFERECPLGHHDCLERLEVDAVVEAVEAPEREEPEPVEERWSEPET